MNPTRSHNPEGRSLRGGVAALSTLAAVAGPTFSTARFEQIVVSGDHVQVTYDAVTAQGIADHLGIGGAPVTWHPERHTWSGTVAELKVDIHGKGFLPSQVPARLVADVPGGIPAQADPRDAADFAALAGTDRGSVNLALAYTVLAATITGAVAPAGTALLGLITIAALGLLAVLTPTYLTRTANRGTWAAPYTTRHLARDLYRRFTPGGRLEDQARRETAAARRQHRATAVTR